MPNLLRADLYVLARSRALWIALVVSSAMAVAYFVSARLIADGTYDMSIAGSVAGFSDAMALPLLGSLLIGVAAASDLENRTVHDRLLAAPRSVHVAVKTVMALAVTAVVLLPYVIGSLLCLSAGWDLAPFLATTPLRVAAALCKQRSHRLRIQVRDLPETRSPAGPEVQVGMLRVSHRVDLPGRLEPLNQRDHRGDRFDGPDVRIGRQDPQGLHVATEEVRLVMGQVGPIHPGSLGSF